MYGWSGYDYALLKHYKDATGADELATALRKVVVKAEEKGNPPPGLFADFAFALYEAGQVDEAIIYFQKERDTWPESAVFMTSVINRITGQNS